MGGCEAPLFLQDESAAEATPAAGRSGADAATRRDGLFRDEGFPGDCTSHWQTRTVLQHVSRRLSVTFLSAVARAVGGKRGAREERESHTRRLKTGLKLRTSERKEKKKKLPPRFRGQMFCASLKAAVFAHPPPHTAPRGYSYRR